MRRPDMELSPQQQEIVVNTTGNVVVSASAGTGKTRTMIAKIIHDLQQNRTHKVIAAITFTINAAQEIRERLTFDVSQNFIGTNNSFVIDEIIKPFMKDVYGDEYDIDMNTDYTDENNKFDTLDEGIEKIKKMRTIYAYKKGLKNFVFDLALTIVKQSDVCRLYLQAKYFNIYIDEYQDCDSDMHAFFMYLCDELNITTFIVGDNKQSIYRWRGANPVLFESIFSKRNFIHKKLTENYRSHKQIQDYSNLLFEHTRHLITQPQNNGNIAWVYATNKDWASKVTGLIDADKTSALLRGQKVTSKTGKYGAQEGADMLTANGIQHTFIPSTPIDDITSNSAWLYTAIARFVLIDTYSRFDFIEDIPAEAEANRKPLEKITQMLQAIKSTVSVNEFDFKNNVTSLFEYLGYSASDQHLKNLYETVCDRKYAVALSPEKPMHCTLTFHSSKGLEFEQVVLFIEDYAYGHCVTEENINNHYVACTRAMSKLIIVDTKSIDAKTMKEKLDELFKETGTQYSQLITFYQ